jgi:hypothetical protein
VWYPQANGNDVVIVSTANQLPASIIVTDAHAVGSVTLATSGGVSQSTNPAYITMTTSPITLTFVPAPTPMPTPTLAPATPTPNPSASPTPLPSGLMYPKSPMYVPMPPNPVFYPASQSAKWMGEQCPGGGQAAGGCTNYGINDLDADSTGMHDGGDPEYAVGGGPLSLTVTCDATSWASFTCRNPLSVVNMNGFLINGALAGMITEGTSDHHIVLDSPSASYQFWDANPIPTSSGEWHVGGAGACDPLGTGMGCSGATATNFAVNMGIIRPEDAIAAIQSGDQYRKLPYALSVAFMCNGTGFVSPATASDGQCFTSSGTNLSSATFGVPEGIRGCLAMTDDAINAKYGAFTLQALIYRTTDCDASHEPAMGFFNRDSAWSGGGGVQLQWAARSAYIVQGKPDYWATLAKMMGLQQSGTIYTFHFSLTDYPVNFCYDAGCTANLGSRPGLRRRAP